MLKIIKLKNSFSYIVISKCFFSLLVVEEQQSISQILLELLSIKQQSIIHCLSILTLSTANKIIPVVIAHVTRIPCLNKMVGN